MMSRSTNRSILAIPAFPGLGLVICAGDATRPGRGDSPLERSIPLPLPAACGERGRQETAEHRERAGIHSSPVPDSCTTSTGHDARFETALDVLPSSRSRRPAEAAGGDHDGRCLLLAREVQDGWVGGCVRRCLGPRGPGVVGPAASGGAVREASRIGCKHPMRVCGDYVRPVRASRPRRAIVLPRVGTAAMVRV
jgi:hypothetical protein